MTEQSAFVILVCEGRRCVPIVDLEDVATTEAEAVTFLRQLAVRLRGMRALGRAVLVEAGSGRQVASAGGTAGAASAVKAAGADATDEPRSGLRA